MTAFEWDTRSTPRYPVNLGVIYGCISMGMNKFHTQLQMGILFHKELKFQDPGAWNPSGKNGWWITGWWAFLTYFLGIFIPKLGEDDFHFDSYFLEGLKPPTRSSCHLRMFFLKLANLLTWCWDLFFLKEWPIISWGFFCTPQFFPPKLRARRPPNAMPRWLATSQAVQWLQDEGRKWINLVEVDGAPPKKIMGFWQRKLKLFGFSPHLLEGPRPLPRQVLEEAGTSISDRTRSYAADTSHDKHSGCVMGGLTKGSPGANQRESNYSWWLQRSGGEKHHLGCLKPCKQQRMFTISTGELAGVLNHQQVYMELEVSSKNPPAESGAIYAHLGGFFPIFQFCWWPVWDGCWCEHFQKVPTWRIIPMDVSG